MCGNGFQHSHSLKFPPIQVPFPPTPITKFLTYSHSHGILVWAIPIPSHFHSVNAKVVYNYYHYTKNVRILVQLQTSDGTFSVLTIQSIHRYKEHHCQFCHLSLCHSFTSCCCEETATRWSTLDSDWWIWFSAFPAARRPAVLNTRSLADVSNTENSSRLVSRRYFRQWSTSKIIIHRPTKIAVILSLTVEMNSTKSLWWYRHGRMNQSPQSLTVNVCTAIINLLIYVYAPQSYII